MALTAGVGAVSWPGPGPGSGPPVRRKRLTGSSHQAKFSGPNFLWQSTAQSRGYCTRDRHYIPSKEH
eukprot:764197-Hanusia_phi.AAC.2